MTRSLASLVFFTASCALAGCADSGTTSGARFELRPRMQLESRTATTRSGWSVTLDKAHIALGELHFFSGEPLGASNRWRRSNHQVLAGADTFWRWADQRLGIASAEAHPGHYVEGDVLGELLTPRTIDLLAGSTELGVAEATSGLYRSARFTFAVPPKGELASEMGDASLVLEGTATKEQESRRFRFRAGGADLHNASQQPALEGCRFEEARIEASGAVIVTADPAIWFAAADFTELAASSDGEPVDVPPGSRLRRQISEQVLASAGIHFRYAAE